MLDVQEAVLNCFFLNSDSFEFINDIQDDYFDGPYRVMFKGIKKLYSEKSPINSETLLHYLEHSEIDSRVCNLDHILKVLNRDSHQVSHSGYFEWYLKQLKEVYARRMLAGKLEEARNEIQVGTVSIDDTRADILEEFGKYEDKKAEVINIRDINIMTSIDLENYYTTGLRDIDKILTGFYNSDLIIIAGRTSTGKSAFSLWLAEQQLAKKGKVLFVSLEMPARQLAYRIFSNYTNIPYQRIRAGNLKSYEYEQLREAKEKVNTNLAIADKLYDARAVNSAIRKYFKDSKGVAIIDYLQLFGSSENRNLEIGRICREFKNLAMELDMPIILLSQFSRSVEMRPDKEPTLSDLRDSGEIEQHADSVLFTHYKNQEDRYKKISELKIIIPKNRNGSTGYCKINFDKAINNFYSLYPD